MFPGVPGGDPPRMTTPDHGDPEQGGPPPGELPLPDFDQLSPGDLEHRIRALGPGELERLLQHERTHARRPLVIEMLSARLAELHAGANPTPGGSPRPGEAEPSRGTSPVSPQTAAQPFSAPPHGSPHQSGRPKGDQRRS